MDLKRKLALDVCNGIGLDTRSIETIYLKMWRNVQANGGYRLTQTGYEWIQELGIKGYQIKLPDDRNMTESMRTGNILLGLDRYLPVPYYIQGKKLVVFDESYGTQLILYAGDLKAFLDANHN